MTLLLRCVSAGIELRCHLGPGGYSLYDGWYICAAVLTPFFDPLGTKLDLFGVFFLIHQHKNDLLGTNPHKIRSFWPQNTIFPSIFLGPIFIGPRPPPPPPPPPPPAIFGPSTEYIPPPPPHPPPPPPPPHTHLGHAYIISNTLYTGCTAVVVGST